MLFDIIEKIINKSVEERLNNCTIVENDIPTSICYIVRVLFKYPQDIHTITEQTGPYSYSRKNAMILK